MEEDEVDDETPAVANDGIAFEPEAARVRFALLEKDVLSTGRSGVSSPSISRPADEVAAIRRSLSRRMARNRRSAERLPREDKDRS